MREPTERGSGPALLLAFVAGAIGGAAGALLMQPRGSLGSGADDSGLKQSIAALDEAVRALGTQVGTLNRSLPQPTQHLAEPLQVPATGDPNSLGLVDVAAVLQQLGDITKLLQGRVAGATSGFAGAAPMPVLDATRGAPNPAALATLSSEDNKEVWRRHAFWSCQQVLDAYGLPDQIEAGDGTMGWYYETMSRSVHFVFFEGMLINVWN